MGTIIITAIIVAVFGALFYGVVSILFIPGTLEERLKRSVKQIIGVGLFFAVLTLISLMLSEWNGDRMTEEGRERYDRAFHNR